MGTKKMKLALRVPEGLKLELQVTVDCLGASIVTKFLQRYALNPTETIAHLSFIPRKTHRTRVKLKLLLPEDLGSRLQLIALVEQVPLDRLVTEVFQQWLVMHQAHIMAADSPAKLLELFASTFELTTTSHASSPVSQTDDQDEVPLPPAEDE